MQLVWTRRLLAASALAAVAGLVAVSPTPAKDPLPEGASVKQIDADLEYIKVGLGKKAKNSVTPLRSSAMLLALNAQNQLDGKDGEKMAGVRDEALKVAGALAAKEVNWDAAVKAVEAAKTAKGDAKKKVKLEEQFDFDVHDLMTAFKPKAKGGRGLEDDVRKFSKTAPDVKAAAEVANLVALIGQYCELMPQGEKADDKKKWADWSADMQKVGRDAAEEALKGDKANKATLQKKFQAIDANCNSCHSVFRKS